jgi:hypothetical protein
MQRFVILTEFDPFPKADVYSFSEQRTIGELETEMDTNLLLHHMTEAVRQKCRKGRLSSLFKLATVWKDNQDFIFNENHQQSLSRYLKPCTTTVPRRETIVRYNP